MFNITLKYFSFFNNKPPASCVTRITRDFLSCYSCSYYSSMILPILFGMLELISENFAFLFKVLFDIVNYNLKMINLCITYPG